ncbi:Protein of unknown function DUF1796 putative papain-like cysteine peptidase [Halothece sp. PCC 7418]|uniref:DUF1796 family putative cysteine peptidase n=1 Tax=Halothece sp. (strain PCC 7418) TaxID=65093 RepID=UPI0002A05B81|nr:DUF1796 family putative cysteine peptidase [Halothece sp. PCC 7418]AFZ44899.1 Protein of unknown function DUF1796 putative papain-like cysteine peptidase [Halothece sp. PCC 7418]
MEHHYISLGAGCDTAMILNKLGLRKKAYPFDWLWNLDAGLTAVNDIIKYNFMNVSSEDAYCRSSHYRLPHPVVVYKNFPEIIHMHSNPMEDRQEHEKLLRRIERFQTLIKSNHKLHFIYYKNYNEEHQKDHSVTVQDTLLKMLNQADKFLDIISNFQRKSTSQVTLLLILQTNIEEKECAIQLLNKTKIEDKRIKVGFTLSRSDKEPQRYRQWEKQWFQNIIRQTEMPIHIILQCYWIMALKWKERVVRVMKQKVKKVIGKYSISQ